MRPLRFFGIAILRIVITLCLAITIVPRFLDAVYYRGQPSAHFDGARFFNPDGEDTFAATPGRGLGKGPGETPNASLIARFITGNDGRPAWPDHIPLHAVQPPARVNGGDMIATWVGHATVLVQTQGFNILTDPIWADTAGPLGIGPKRVTPPGIPFDKLPKIDVVLVSHDHYDHMDLDTLGKLWKRDHPRVITSLGNDSVIAQAGVPATALDWGGRVWVGPGEVIVTRNHHWGSRWFADRNRALWSSFVVTLPGGNIFFAGDTGAGDYKWADEAAAYGPVRLALIPIGAFRFSAGQMVAGSHIGPIDAAEIYARLHASTGIGVHWGTFRLSYEAHDTPPRMLREVVKCRGLHGFGTVYPGRPVRIAPYTPQPAAVPAWRAASCLDSPAIRTLP